jgi:hypothetical protein
MPEFKKNTSSAMKKSGFKMKGYSYPGTSPMKGRAAERRMAASTRQTEAKEEMKDAFDNEFKKNQSGPIAKVSPTKSAWATIGTEVLKAAVGTGVSAGIGALTKDKKKERREVDVTTGNQSFSSSKIV